MSWTESEASYDAGGNNIVDGWSLQAWHPPHKAIGDYVLRFSTQYVVLLYKISLQLIRSPIFVIIMLLTGFFLVTLMSLANVAASWLFMNINQDEPRYMNTTFPECDSPGCYDLFYNRKENLEVVSIINEFATKYGVNESKIKGFEGDDEYEIDLFLFENVETRPFCGVLFKYDGNQTDQLPIGTGLVIQSEQFSFSGSDVLGVSTLGAFIVHNQVKKKLAGVGITYPEYNMTFVRWPSYLDVSTGIELSSSLGAAVLNWVIMVPIAIQVIMVVHEKEKMMVLLMRLMGLMRVPYWLAYFSFFFFFNTLNMSLFVIFGWIYGLGFIRANNFFIMLSYALVSAYVMMPLGMIFTTFVGQVRIAIMVIFGLIIVLTIASLFPIGLVMELDNTFPTYELNLGYIGNIMLYFFVAFTKYVVPFVSPFLSLYGFQAFTGGGTGTLSTSGGSISFENIFSNFAYLSIGYHYIWFAVDFVIYLLLLWYLEQVLKSKNGKGLPFYFPFTLHYWTGYRLVRGKFSIYGFLSLFFNLLFKSKHERDTELIDSYLDAIEDDHVREERARVQNGEFDREPLMFKDVRKHFRGTRKTFHAVNGLSFHVKKNEIFGLLGPNGAGKTTSINMLIGLFEPTFGDIVVQGLSCRDDIGYVRRLIGVCPQDNNIWGELSAQQHLFIFSVLKRVPLKRIGQEIELGLTKVNLMEARNRRAAKLSGGMKRRLSLAIALIGNPPILILDEPTTGLDPKTRQDIWDVISKCKKGRSTLLTTHSMEEADSLSDRIGIVVNGRLRCIGDSLSLKNMYGSGYRLFLALESGRAEEIRTRLVESEFPISFLNETYTSMIVQVGVEHRSKIPAICRVLEDIIEEENSGLLTYSISMATMIEVFLNISKVTKKEKKGASMRKQARKWAKHQSLLEEVE